MRDRRPGTQDGFTIFEVMVAATLLVGGILAVLAIFISNTKAETSATRVEVAVQFGERHLEWMRSLPYEQLAMCEAPTYEDEPSPNSEIDGDYLHVGAGKMERMVVAPPDGTCHPDLISPTPFTVGTGESAVSGHIYRYATWRDERCPVIDLAELATNVDAQLATLQDEISEITVRLDSVVTQLGSVPLAIESARLGLQGSLARLEAITDPSSVVTRTQPLRDALPGVIQTTQEAEATANAVTTLLARFQSLESSVQAVRDKLATGSPSGSIDLCNLSADLTGLDELSELVGLDLTSLVNIELSDIGLDLPGLDVLPTGLADLDAYIEGAADDVESLTSQLLGTTCDLLPSACELLLNDIEAVVNGALDEIALASDATDAQAPLAMLDDMVGQLAVTDQLTTLDGELTTSISTIDGSVDSLLAVAEQTALGEVTDENTKRILVAVTIDGERGDLAPREPVWIQSIVIDPDAALVAAS